MKVAVLPGDGIGPEITAQAVRVLKALAGQGLSIELETARRERALVLPLDALRRDEPDGQGTVWLVQGRQVEVRNVRLGLRTVDAVEVLQGLSAGDTVLLGTQAAPGQPVRADVDAVKAAAAAGSKGGNAAAALSNAMGR